MKRIAILAVVLLALCAIAAQIPYQWFDATPQAGRTAIHASHDVGIETSSPDTTLQVVGDCKFGDDNTNYLEISSTGDAVFVGSSGLVFGEIYAQDNAVPTAIAIAGKANKVQVTVFDTNGQSNNATPDHASDHITVIKAGMYMANISMSVSGAGGDADDFGFSIWKNDGNTEFANLHTHRKLAGGAGDRGSVSMSGIIDCAVDDTIEVWTWNEDDTDNLTIDDITLTLVQVGGT